MFLYVLYLMVLYMPAAVLAVIAPDSIINLVGTCGLRLGPCVSERNHYIFYLTHTLTVCWPPVGPKDYNRN